MKSKQNLNCLLNCHHQHKSYARCIKFLCLNLAERWNFIKKHNICPKLNCQNCSKKTKVPCKFCQSFNHHYHLCGNMKGKQNAARISLRFQKQIAENKISKTRKLKSDPESNPNHSRSPPLCQQSVDRKLAPVQKGVNVDITNASGPDLHPTWTNLDPSLTMPSFIEDEDSKYAFLSKTS